MADHTDSDRARYRAQARADHPEAWKQNDKAAQAHWTARAAMDEAYDAVFAAEIERLGVRLA